VSAETLNSVEKKYDMIDFTNQVGVPLNSAYQVGEVSNHMINMLRYIEQDNAYLCYMSNTIHERTIFLKSSQFNCI